MPVPHLLLVDDSDAILAYEAAALSGHYTLSTATNGREALEKLGEMRPAAVLLDLSMPEMTGDELLARMQADPALRGIPVVVVSSEKSRGEASRDRGARAFLPKPIRAAELQALIARVLEQERLRARADELSVLFLRIGALEVGIPLDPVREVVAHPMTRHVPMAPDYLSQMIEYRGNPILVLDLASRLGAAYVEPLHERKLVVIEVDGRLLAVAVDGVRAPEAFLGEDVVPKGRIGGADHAPLVDVLVVIVKTPRGPVPVVNPTALLSIQLLDSLGERLAALRPASRPPAERT